MGSSLKALDDEKAQSKLIQDSLSEKLKSAEGLLREVQAENSEMKAK